jgi:hypothetical protein
MASSPLELDRLHLQSLFSYTPCNSLTPIHLDSHLGIVQNFRRLPIEHTTKPMWWSLKSSAGW